MLLFRIDELVLLFEMWVAHSLCSPFNIHLVFFFYWAPVAVAPDVPQLCRLTVPARLWMFPLAPPGALMPTIMRETSSRERGNCGREMTSNFADKWRVPCHLKGSFTCRKSASWDQWLYFPSDGRHAEDFFALNNPTALAGFEPANLGTPLTTKATYILSYTMWSKDFYNLKSISSPFVAITVPNILLHAFTTHWRNGCTSQHTHNNNVTLFNKWLWSTCRKLLPSLSKRLRVGRDV
jgi:hypothetical protein